MTGGTGLIGRAFIRQYPEHTFTVLTRTPKLSQRSLGSHINLIESLEDLHDLNGFDAVINLAGEPIIDKRWSDKQKAIICNSRWHITKHLVDLFNHSDQPPKVFLSGSAIGVYGHQGDTELLEDSPTGQPDFPTEVCSNWESIALNANGVTRVVLLRTGIVLAKQGGALAKMLLPFKLGLGGPIGQGRQYMSWIHLQDHIRAMAYLLEQPDLSGPVNLTAPTPQPNRQFSQTLARVLKRPAFLPMPPLIMRMALGESACLLLDSQNVIPNKLENSGFEFRYRELEPALNDLINQ
ncbi:MAG: TIGR01777 family oxidoreductase [Candidatus Pelagadaptatus aseana]